MINLAQIGVGYWGPNLLRNLMSNLDCVVKLVVDISAERRDFVKRLYPTIKVSDCPEDVFNYSDIQGVVIATPVASHFDLAMKSLDAGKNVLVEKPIATTVEQVAEIDRLAQEMNLVAMAGHTFLYNAAVRYVKQLIDSGELGDIRYIYSQRVNLGRIRSDVDALWNLAPHDISILQYWLNDPNPVSIQRSGMAYVQDGIDDVVFLNITYPGNVLANIHVSWLDPHKIRKMTVVGSKKMVVYDDLSKNKISIYDKGIDDMAVLGRRMDFDDPIKYTFKHRRGDVVFPKIKWREPLQVEIEHFIDCIQSGIECLTGMKHAIEVVKILSFKSKNNISLTKV